MKLPVPKPPSSSVLLDNAKTKITLALEAAQKAQNPTTHLETALHELDEDTTMLTELSKEDQLNYQVESLKFLCNSMIRNAKLASKMTRIVNTEQVKNAVSKTLLMEDFNPVHMSLSQFLAHPSSAEVWQLANHHDSDFVKHNKAWGHWWMGIVQSQAPRQRLRRTLQHVRMFNQLAVQTFMDFGQNPTRFSTEWLVIQLVRLGDHLLAAGIKSEYGFNWPHAYQKIAAFLARNKMTEVAEIFTKIEPLWPSGIRMNFHYNQPAFNDCVLELAENDNVVGKIPAMKKMKHRHDQLFGGPDVANRENSDSDSNVNTPMGKGFRDFDRPSDHRSAPAVKKHRRNPSPQLDYASEDENWSLNEPREAISYADLFK